MFEPKLFCNKEHLTSVVGGSIAAAWARLVVTKKIEIKSKSIPHDGNATTIKMFTKRMFAR